MTPAACSGTARHPQESVTKDGISLSSRVWRRAPAAEPPPLRASGFSPTCVRPYGRRGRSAPGMRPHVGAERSAAYSQAAAVGAPPVAGPPPHRSPSLVPAPRRQPASPTNAEPGAELQGNNSLFSAAGSNEAVGAKTQKRTNSAHLPDPDLPSRARPVRRRDAVPQRTAAARPRGRAARGQAVPAARPPHPSAARGSSARLHLHPRKQPKRKKKTSPVAHPKPV